MNREKINQIVGNMINFIDNNFSHLQGGQYKPNVIDHIRMDILKFNSQVNMPELDMPLIHNLLKEINVFDNNFNTNNWKNTKLYPDWLSLVYQLNSAMDEE